MKHFFSSKQMLWSMAVLALAVTSCYKISEIVQPSEVAAGEEFTVKATIIHDDSDDDNDDDRYCCLGIRVPEGWDVEIPANALEYYMNNNKAAEMTLVPNEVYTNMMNYRYPKEGYVWKGYSTGVDGDAKKKITVHKDLSDKIVMNVKIKAGDTEGDYELDYLFGDETEGFNKYADNLAYDPNSDNRLFECGTFAAPDSEAHVKNDGSEQRSIHNVWDGDTRITVKGTGGVETIKADEFAIEGSDNGMIRFVANGASVADAIVTVYNVSGVKLDSRVVSGGEAMLKAQKGVCLVEVLKGNRKAVRKLVVK